MEDKKNMKTGNGIPVDNVGGPTVDPTKNVLADERDKRLDSRFVEEQKHVREILGLTREYEDKLKIAEAKRIDSIRVVDVQAVQTANDKATQQAQVLATQLTTSAETLRALVASQAQATAAQLTQIITPITDRLALLEKNQYQGAGKESVTDPLMNQLLAEMKATRDTIGEGTGRSQGASSTIAYIVMALGIMGAIFGAISFFR